MCPAPACRCEMCRAPLSYILRRCATGGDKIATYHVRRRAKQAAPLHGGGERASTAVGVRRTPLRWKGASGGRFHDALWRRGRQAAGTGAAGSAPTTSWAGMGVVGGGRAKAASAYSHWQPSWGIARAVVRYASVGAE